MNSVDDNHEYREIFNLPTHLICVFAPDGTFRKTNSAQKHILGWDPDLLIGRPVSEFLHPDDAPRTAHEIGRLFQGGPVITDFRNRCLHREGGYRWISWSGSMTNGLVYAIGTDVTDRVNTETRFRTFFEQSKLPIQIYSLDGDPVAVNDAWEELFATSREQLQGYNILKDPQLEAKGLMTYLKRAYAGEAVEVPPIYYDPALIGKVGRARWLEAWFSPVKDDTGQMRELAMLLKDVTRQREAEEDLRVTTERLLQAAETGKIGIWDWTPGSEQLTWNDTIQALFGFAPGTFPGTIAAYRERMHPDDREVLWRAVEKSLATGESYSVEHRVLLPDGSIRWLLGSGRTIFDRARKPLKMIGTTVDITEPKEAAQDQAFLAKAAEVLSSSLDHRSTLAELTQLATAQFCDICLVDLNLSGSKMERIAASHRDPSLGQLMFDMHRDYPLGDSELHPTLAAIQSPSPSIAFDVDDAYLQRVAQCRGQGFADILRKLGILSVASAKLQSRTRVLGAIAFIATKASGRKLGERNLKIIEDLGHRISLALENSLLYQNAQEAIRARDDFLSIASHELKTPLTSLKLQVQMRDRLLRRGNLEEFSPEKLRRMFGSDAKQIERLSLLVEDMLDIARINTGKLSLNNENFDLCEVIRDVNERLSANLQAARCAITVDLEKAIQGSWDRFRIEQVYVNLLTNAMKYGSHGAIQVRAFRQGPFAVLCVKDQGIGIAPENHERIFNRFERAISAQDVSGLGLGLYIVREILEAHGGQISVESRLGEGATFTVKLPLTR